MEDSGTLGDHLRGDGHTLRVVETWREAVPAGDWPLAVVLGGPQNAYDKRLSGVRRFVAQRLRRNLPMLGICLGAQIIAAAGGGRVYRGSRPEIGFFHDITITTDDANGTDGSDNQGGLFAGIESPMTVFQWHAETFDPPAGAPRLAASSSYPNQAFRLGNAVGLQFHLEIDAPLVERWLADDLDRDARAHDVDPTAIRARYRALRRTGGRHHAPLLPQL